jgi:hypothetical protein
VVVRRRRGSLRAAVACSVAIAWALGGCGGCERAPAPTSAGSSRSSDTLSPTPPRAVALRPGVSTTKAGFVYRVAADARHLAWLTGPVEEESLPTAVYVRPLRSSKSAVLSKGVDAGYGLASAANWVVYATTSERTRLIAVRPDGSHRTELSEHLATPIAARGGLVAWGEQTSAELRVMVRDMAAGRNWVAAHMRRCHGARCYRIDTVTLARDGVVFTRVASDPDVSSVLRRAFTDRAASEVRIPGDPQPELRPSSAGALYYVLGRGWYRWDFGRARPRRTPFESDPPAPLIAFEHGRWLLLTGTRCRTGLVAVGPDGRRTIVSSPARLLRLVRSPHGVCAQFGGLTATGRQLLTGWGLAPKEEEEAHEVEEPLGVVAVSRPLR